MANLTARHHSDLSLFASSRMKFLKLALYKGFLRFLKPCLFSAIPSLKLNEIRRLDAASLKKVSPQQELSFMGNSQLCDTRLSCAKKSGPPHGGNDDAVEGHKPVENGTMPSGEVRIPRISIREEKGVRTECAKGEYVLRD